MGEKLILPNIFLPRGFFNCLLCDCFSFLEQSKNYRNQEGLSDFWPSNPFSIFLNENWDK